MYTFSETNIHGWKIDLIERISTIRWVHRERIKKKYNKLSFGEWKLFVSDYSLGVKIHCYPRNGKI